MAETKFYTAEKEINGVKYVCQFSGVSTALRAIDSTYIDGTSVTSIEKLAEYLFKYIVVEPKGLSIDDFDNMDDLNEVITFAREVMQGDFRDKKDASATKAKG